MDGRHIYHLARLISRAGWKIVSETLSHFEQALGMRHKYTDLETCSNVKNMSKFIHSPFLERKNFFSLRLTRREPC